MGYITVFLYFCVLIYQVRAWHGKVRGQFVQPNVSGKRQHIGT